MPCVVCLMYVVSIVQNVPIGDFTTTTIGKFFGYASYGTMHFYLSLANNRCATHTQLTYTHMNIGKGSYFGFSDMEDPNDDYELGGW